MEGRQHVHKSYIPLYIIRSIGIAIMVVVLGSLSFLQNADFTRIDMAMDLLSDYVIWMILTVISYLIIMSVIVFISYKRLTFEITENEVSIYKGIIIKKRAHIPYKRIHAVNLKAKLLDRIFGVITLSIDTAGGKKSRADAIIPALKLQDAEKIKAEIFKRKSMEYQTEQGAAPQAGERSHGSNVFSSLGEASEDLRGAFGGETGFDQPVSCEYKLSNKELFLYCMTNLGAIVFMFSAFFAVIEIVDVIGVFNQAIVDTGEEMLNEFMRSSKLIVIAFGVLTFLIIFIIMTVARALTFGSFVARRRGDRVEVSRGMIERRSEGVAIDRIQTLQIKKSLFHRIIKHSQITVETAATAVNEKETPGVIIHPMIRDREVANYINDMLPEFNDIPAELAPLSKLAGRRSVFRYMLYTFLLFAVPVLIVYVMTIDMITGHFDADWLRPELLLTLIIPILFMGFIGWAAWKGRAYARNSKYVAMRHGVTSRNRVYLPKKKIQYAVSGQNPFQKIRGLASITAFTATAGVSSSKLKDVRVEIANDYLEWVEPGQ